MTNGESVLCMREQVDAVGALRIVGSIGDTSKAAIERKIYYPYFWFRARCRTTTLLGRRVVSANCLIDARNGLGATADSFETEASMVEADALLAARTTVGEADRAARRFVAHSFGRSLRMLADFGVTTKALGLVYKAFWLVRVGGLTVLVDSMTGSVYPMKAQ